jgi:protein mago nashi
MLIAGKHKMFTTSKIGSYSEISNCKDEEGLSNFWYLMQDVKCFVLSLINAHFRIRPVQ